MSIKKWKLPSKVTDVDVDGLNQVHIVTMLEYLGAKAASSIKKDRVEALRAAIAQNEGRAQMAYDVIVMGQLPQAAEDITKNAEAMRAHFYGVMTKLLAGDQAEQLRGSIEKHVENMATKLEGRLEQHGKKLLAEAAENYRPVVIHDGKKQRVVKGVLPKEFQLVVQLAGQRVPTMLVGPAGCGKTYIAGKVAEALGLEFYDQSCSEGVSESIFTGWLLPVTAGGAFTYVASPYITAYEEGGVFLLDEMDASDPNLLTFLNKSIANEFFYLPQRHKQPLVKKHRDFVVIGAANTFGHGANAQYVGRNALDAATLDRFRAGMIHMDYSAEVEGALVDPAVLAWGRKVREFINRHQLRRIMSTRVMLDLTKMSDQCEWKQDQWERAYFADWSREEMAKWKENRA